jgi:tetratricopeptide (TPR) repeat protein
MRFVIWITIACVIGIVLTVPGVAVAQHATPSEEAALQAYREGSFSRAVQLYTKALSETDDSSHRAQLHVSIGWTLFALGRQGEVDTHLRAALVEDPELSLVPDYYTKEFIDIFESTKRRVRTAERDLSATPPPDLEATVSSISQRLDSGSDLEGALADVNRLLVAYPQDGRLLPLKAELLRQLGRDDEAAEILHAYGTGYSDVPVDTLSIPDLILRANRLIDEGDVETAFGLLREAVSRQPSNVAALELMAEAAVRTGRWQDAEFALKSALALQPDNLNLQLRLGGVYLAKDDPSAARDIFQQLTERYPHSDRAWAALGLLDARLSNTERALNELAMALHENPLLPEVQIAYGELELAGGDPLIAIEAFEAARNLLQSDPQLEARTGQALLALGRDAEALEHLRDAIDGGYTPPDVQRAFALALVANGLYAEAERLIADIPADQSKDLGIVRGYLLLERGANAEAEAVLRQVAEDRPTDPAVLNMLATVVYRQQRYPEAVALLQRAVELDPSNELWSANLANAASALSAEALASNAAAVRPATP